MLFSVHLNNHINLIGIQKSFCYKTIKHSQNQCFSFEVQSLLFVFFYIVILGMLFGCLFIIMRFAVIVTDVNITIKSVVITAFTVVINSVD